jgi:drug/metabolite transporter (DMT)-like permease
MILLNESLTGTQLLGGGLVLVGIVIAQIAERTNQE